MSGKRLRSHIDVTLQLFDADLARVRSVGLQAVLGHYFRCQFVVAKNKWLWSTGGMPIHVDDIQIEVRQRVTLIQLLTDSGRARA